MVNVPNMVPQEWFVMLKLLLREELFFLSLSNAQGFNRTKEPCNVQQTCRTPRSQTLWEVCSNGWPRVRVKRLESESLGL